MRRMVVNGFRFNTMMDREAHRLGALAPADIIERLEARTTTTNRPPAPVVTMLGELRRRGGGLGVVSMCAGGGMGAAMVLEVPAA